MPLCKLVNRVNKMLKNQNTMYKQNEKVLSFEQGKRTNVVEHLLEGVRM